MAEQTTTLTVVNAGYKYDLTKLPDQKSPLIQAASKEILRDMQIDSIIQNLENVAKLMFVAYNALSGTMVQSKMSGLQKKYLDLMDESEQAIITFRYKSELICNLVVKAYKWLLKGKEKLALTQFNNCAEAAAEMARQAERLADGFQTLSNQAETVLESTQDESALQYKEIEKVKAELDRYNANLEKCKSLSQSLDEDIKSINQVYEEAKKKEKEAFDMKKGLQITQIITGCIGAVIPSVTGIVSNMSGKAGGAAAAGVNQAASEAQKNVDKDKAERDKLTAQQKTAQSKLDELTQQKASLQKEIDGIQQSIEAKEAVTVGDEAERAAALAELKKQLAEKQADMDALNKELSNTQNDLKNTSDRISELTNAIDALNKQISDFADQARDDLERAEASAKEALKTKLELEKQRRETLGSIQEFTALIQSGVRRQNVAETAVQTLQVAIRCIKQVVVALSTAAKFWRSMEEYCKTLSDSGLGKEIVEISEGLTLEERLDYYQDGDFMTMFLKYICRWAALYYVCDEYQTRNNKVRKLVADNIQSSSTREEEWKRAGELAEEMSASIQMQVEESNTAIAELNA